MSSEPVEFPLSGPASLARLWQQQVRFGVLVLAEGGLPDGALRDVVLAARWSGVRIHLPARVEAVSGGPAVLRILDLPDVARRSLVALGLPDAATHQLPALPAPPAPSSAAASPPDAAPAGPTAPDPPAPAPGAATQPGPAAPPTAPMPAIPANVGPRPNPTSPLPAAAPFRPTAVAFRPASAPLGAPSSGSIPAVSPSLTPTTTSRIASPQPTSGSLPPIPSSGPTAPATTSPQLQAISTSAGPGRAGSEALLPPATEQGDFGSLSWRDVLLHFFTRRSTGVLVIHGFREVRWCYLLDGQPLHYRGDQPHAGEFLYDALVQGTAIGQEEWTQALRMQQVTGLPAGEYLVARGRLTRQDLDLALCRRATRITRYLLSANFGRFTFHPLEDLRMVFRHPPVEVLPLLLEAQRQGYAALDDDALIKKCEPLYPLSIQLVPARKDILDRLPLTAEERRLVNDVLPACWPLKELVGLKEMEERQLLRFMLSLTGLGVVEVVKDEGATARRNRVERKLYHAARDLRRRSAFEALHAHWSSSPKEVEEGYRTVLGEYADNTFSDLLDDRIRGRLAEIRSLADTAWRKVSTVGARKEYRKGVVGSDQLRMASDLLDKQAEMALFKGDFPLARACYDRIVELDPGNDGGEVLNRAKAQLADPRILAAAELPAGALDGLHAQFDTLVDGD